MSCHPGHLDGFARAPDPLFGIQDTENHKHFQVVCSCGGREFSLWMSDRDSVLAECASCSTRIVLYDLQYYPAAAKLDGKEQFTQMAIQDRRPLQVVVAYEYPLPEDDVPFNRDDITWCQILVASPHGDIVKVFDDETC